MNKLRKQRRWSDSMAHVAYALAAILVFLSPFPRFTAPFEIAFYGIFVLTLFLHVSRKCFFSLNSPLTVPFVLFFAWTAFGLCLALDPKNSMKDLYGHFIKYVFFYYLLINYFPSRSGTLTLAWIITIAAGLFSGSAIFFHYILFQNPLSSRLGIPAVNGLSSDYIGYTTVPALLLGFLLIEKSSSVWAKILSVSLAAVTVSATILTHSRATFIALFCSLIILYWRKKAALGIASLLLLSLVFFSPSLSERFTVQQFVNNERVGIYLTTWHVIRDYPVAGIGFGMQTYGNPDLVDLNDYNQRVSPDHRQPSPLISPHNTLLDTAVRTGGIGLLIYLYMQFVFVRMGWAVIRNGRDDDIRRTGLYVMSAYGAIFIQGLFSDGAFGPQALMLYFAFALMTILWKIVEADHNTPVMATGALNGAQK